MACKNIPQKSNSNERINKQTNKNPNKAKDQAVMQEKWEHTTRQS